LGRSDRPRVRYGHVAVGGTFDLIHSGHDEVLEKALEIGERVTIGLTTDELVSQMYKGHKVANYKARLSALKGFLSDRNALDRTEIVPLKDPFGSAAYESDFDAIVVSRETKRGAEQINEIRRTKNMSELAIVVIEMVLGEDGIPISSTRIRKGVIDRHGRLRSVRSDVA
jgi:cytidyltransferase-like protein